MKRCPKCGTEHEELFELCSSCMPENVQSHVANGQKKVVDGKQGGSYGEPNEGLIDNESKTQGDELRVSSTKKKTCPQCGVEHDGFFERCYSCMPKNARIYAANYQKRMGQVGSIKLCTICGKEHQGPLYICQSCNLANDKEKSSAGKQGVSYYELSEGLVDNESKTQRDELRVSSTKKKLCIICGAEHEEFFELCYDCMPILTRNWIIKNTRMAGSKICKKCGEEYKSALSVCASCNWANDKEKKKKKKNYNNLFSANIAALKDWSIWITWLILSCLLVLVVWGVDTCGCFKNEEEGFKRTDDNVDEWRYGQEVDEHGIDRDFVDKARDAFENP